jgi:hypothetical protein
MAKGGWIVKFDNKEVEKCWAVSFYYDAWEYSVNNEERKSLPNKLGAIKIEIGED